MGNKKSEFEIVTTFTRILNLPNRTDGTLFIYPKPQQEGHWAQKPDGYYYAEGVTFILDAKAERQPFTGQLEDYMNLEQNENFVGFKYSGDVFKCYIRGEFKENEREPQNYQYYIDTYFQNRHTNESIVEKSAQKLANMFRSARIDKQMNVPFIGAVMLCLKFNHNIDHITTAGILRNIKIGIEDIISDTPLERRQKKEFLKTVLGDSTLNKCKFEYLLPIISEISTIYNFINVSERIGHDTMNNFLKVFRHWNSANANEKGEVFTPDHIAQLMYKLINCSKDDIILDPTCGSGTFLTNAMANMLNECQSEEERKDVKENRVLGIEDNDFNATLAGINMMLHGDGASNIFCQDCFKQLPKLRNCYNKVLMNPPFSQNIPELKFVLEALNNQKQNGLLATILPVSCAIGQKFKDERKEILSKHHLLKIITLPPNLFQPNAGTNTCIMVFKAHEPHSNPILQYDFSDDGFIIAKHIGRIDKNNKEKTIEFFKQEGIKKDVDYKCNWLLEKKIDWVLLTKLDFMKTKLDFMLMNKNLYQEVLNNNGKLNININVSDVSLNITNWKEGKVSDILTRERIKSISSRIRTFYQGDIPVVTNTALNNGIDRYLEINDEKYVHSGNCLSYGAKGGKFFYQPYKWASTDHVHKFTNPNLNEYNQIFLCTILNKIIEIKGGWGASLESNILDQEIMYPVDSNGQPDWKWMEKYIKNEL